MKGNRKFIAIILTVFMVFSISNSTFAVYMTDAELDKAIETFKSNLEKEAAESENSEEIVATDFDVKREGNKIIVTSEEETMEFNYDFSTEGKFYKDMEITKDMSLEETTEILGQSSEPIYGFILTAMNKGCKALDALAYIFVVSLENLKIDFTIGNETLNMTGLEYAKEYYQNSQTIDNELFKISTEVMSETDEKIILRTSCIVKADGDYTKVNGTFEKLVAELENAFSGNENTAGNTNSTGNNTNTNVNINTNKDSESSKDKEEKEWPQAGIDTKQIEILKITAYVLVVGIILVGGSLLAKKSK